MQEVADTSMSHSLSERDEQLFELLQVDLANVRHLMKLLEHRVQYEQPDIQARVSLTVMGRRLDAIIANSHELLAQPSAPANDASMGNAVEFRTERRDLTDPDFLKR